MTKRSRSRDRSKTLKARLRLLDLIDGKPPFQVLIMREPSRFSRRDGDEAFGELKKIARAGVKICFYQDRTFFAYGSFESNVKGFLKAEVAAEFRRNIAKNMYEATLRKARAGNVTGGKTFGYDNVPVNGHKEHRINDAEAEIVREVYQRYGEGHGYRAIPHALNERYVPTARAQRGRPDGWDCDTIRDLLKRPLYRGLYVWNRSKKRNDEGEQRQHARPESDRLIIEMPHLRIVDERLSAAVDARPDDRRGRYLNATKGQRPAGGKYLLSGMLRCWCGSNLETQKPAHGERPGSVYVGAAHRRKGRPSVRARSRCLSTRPTRPC